MNCEQYKQQCVEEHKKELALKLDRAKVFILSLCPIAQDFRFGQLNQVVFNICEEEFIYRDDPVKNICPSKADFYLWLSGIQTKAQLHKYFFDKDKSNEVIPVKNKKWWRFWK